MKDFTELFNRYAQASLSNNAGDVANYYADNFIAVSGTQTQSFTNDDSFLKWLESVFEFNKKTGMKEMIVREVRTYRISSTLINAAVTWSVTFEKKPDTNINFEINYLLIANEGKEKIVLYSSVDDQEALMKSHGII